MAKKGQAFQKYDNDKLKIEVLNKYLSGISSTYLQNQYGIPKGTIKTWANKYKKQGNLSNDIFHKRGRQKESELTKEDYKERYEILKKYQAFLKAQREKK